MSGPPGGRNRFAALWEDEGGLPRLLMVGLLLAGLLAIAYGNTLQVPFVFDDGPNIVENEGLRINSLQPSQLLAAARSGPSAHRWLPNLSFALNYYFGGEGEVAGFHVVNIAVHLVAALLFFLLASATLALPACKEHSPQAAEIALFATLIWALHPLQTNAVTYIVQRMTSLAALCFMASLWLYVQGRLRMQAGRRSFFFLWGASLLCGALAVISKENAVMLPVMVVAYEFFFFAEARRSDWRKILAGAGLALVVVACFARLYLGAHLVETIQEGYLLRDFTLAERLLTQPRVLFFYLSLLAAPLPARLNLCHDVAFSRALLVPPQTALALFALLALVILAGYLFRRDRLLSFALFWFLGNLLIESSFIPLYLCFEHRLYLPSTFLILAVVAGGSSWLGRSGQWRRWWRGCLVAIICLCTLLTWQRNQVWTDPLALWQDVVSKSPNLVGGYQNVGKILFDRKRDIEAESILLKGIAVGREKRSAPRVGSEVAVSLGEMYFILDRLYLRNGRESESFAAAEAALRYNPNHAKAMVSKGIFLEKTGRSQAAVQFYRAASLRGEESAILYCNWAVSLFRLGRVDEAIVLLQRALALDPRHPDSHYNLGIAYGSKGMVAEARREMALAMQLQQQQQQQQQSR